MVILEKYNVKFQKVTDKSLLGATKRGSSGFGSAGLSVIKKTKLDDWVISGSDDKKVSESPESPKDKEEEQQIVSEEATMEVNGKVIIHEKITIH